MKIAVAYENGNVFEHFGHSRQFKIYETDGQNIVKEEVIESEGSGHSAMAGLLAGLDINAVICGGIGGGAANALGEAGIEVYSGVSGYADEALEAYLNGELISEGVNCSHHSHEEEQNCGAADTENESCGCGCGCGSDTDEGGCSCGSNETSGCGGCSGCGGGAPLFDGANVGKVCRVHYKGTFNDGTQFDSSYDRGEPLEFTCGAGMMILGFDKAVADMNVGDIIDVHLMPEEAYGEKDPDAIITVPISELAGSEELKVDDMVYLQNVYGQPFPAKVTALTENDITFDANHEMAGKLDRLLRINLPVTYIRKQRLRKDISYREILSASNIIIYKWFIVLIFTCEMFRAYLLKYIDLFLILNIENYFNMELFFLINYSSCNIYTTCRSV